MYGMDPDRLAVVCRTHGVRLLLQFGSTVSGREHAASDVDLAVLLERGRVLWTHTSISSGISRRSCRAGKSTWP